MPVQKDIIATVAYFDLFDYPVTQTEIYLFLQHAYSEEQLASALLNLTEEKFLYHLDEFYLLQNNYFFVEKRRKDNKKAAQMMATANKVSAFISTFPYVRCVAISGSLSKNVADEKADIDFFIICVKNRLWISRTLLMLFRKLTVLANKQHLFCMNYFIDEERLQIEEQNIYTATEIVTLIPMRGKATFEDFRSANQWVTGYLPNHNTKTTCLEETKISVVKKVIESFFNLAFFNGLEIFLQRLTNKRYQKKESNEKRNSRGVILSLKTSKHFAKQNPEQFQFRLLSKYENKVQELYKRMEASLALVKE